MEAIDTLKLNVELAKDAVSEATDAYEAACEALREASPESKHASDYELVVSGDDSWCWSSTAKMLDDVFGDCWCDDIEHDGGCELGKCTPSDYAKAFIDAFEGGYGVSAYHAVLKVMDPVTGELEEQDSCGGFFGLGGDGAPLDQITDQLVPSGLDGDVNVVFE